MSYTFLPVHPAKLEETWPFVVGFLTEALETRWSIKAQTIDNVKRRIEEGAEGLWVIVKDQKEVTAALTTEVSQYPLQRLFRINLLGGIGYEEFKPLLAELEDVAAGWGCTGMEIWCRPGFSRYLKTVDYEPGQISMFKEFEKEINDE